jgi:CheY-like chemotaxis protein/two-component sensor histidine kinase
VSRAKDEFLATISHELRNPLNAIMGWAHLMRTGNLDDQRRARAVETIERNARLQTALIEDLLDVSRISRGKISLKFRAVSLAAIVDSAVSAIRPTADAKGVQLDLQCRELDVVVNADPDRLQQIVWNLVSNAIKFTASGGRVDVTVWREGQELKLAVRDTGQGIRDEFLPYVFEPFRQGESGTMRSQQGLGLGLAIVKQLAELHGGSVVARSDGEGKGATFEVTLPSPESQSLEGVVSSPQQAEDNSLAGVDVLVVDDEPDSRMLLAELLDSYGMSVSLAASAREALSAIESKPPAVLLSDIGMPGEDGYSLIQKIRSLPSDRGGKMLAIALTGYGGTSDGERALKSGFEKVIVKPVEPDLLIEALRVLVLKGGDPKEEPARLRKI